MSSLPTRNHCVVSIFYNVGPNKPWWNDFPHRITQALDAVDVDHQLLYKKPRPAALGLSGPAAVTVEDVISPRWVAANLLPLVNRYRRVVLHTHCWPAHTALWVPRHFAKASCRWVMTDHFVFPAHAGNLQPWKCGIRKTLRRFGYYPDEFIAVSHFSRIELEKLFGSGHIETIHNGIDLPVFPEPARLQERPSRALFAGRLIPEKGIGPLLESVKLARDRNVPLTLEILGGGAEEGRIRAYLHEHALEDRVTLIGTVQNINDYYRRSHMVLIPSLWQEPFGLVSVEAQACFLPCIYSNRGGLVETQVDGKTGIMLQDPENPEEILAAILRLQEDPDAYHRMRLAAHRHAQQFSMDRMVEGYCRVYERMLEG